MVRFAVEVDGVTLSSASAWQILYMFQVLWASGTGWIGREAGGLPASVLPHVDALEAAALAAARALERSAMVAATANHAERYGTPDRWRLRADEAWWRAKAVGHFRNMMVHYAVVNQMLPTVVSLPLPR